MSEVGLNVLSLFDGMSCGRIALERAGIKVDNYYASEVDKSAIKVSQANWKDVVTVGDVTKVSYSDGVLWTEAGNFKLSKIDLLIAGSPCQGFSVSGKQVAFNDERSKLYFEFERILKEIQSENKDVKFLLENVRMKKEYMDVITERLGVEPVEINSKFVSAQSRRRLYWSNVKITTLVDKGILCKDALDNYVENTLTDETVKSQLDTLLRSSKYAKNYEWTRDKVGRILVKRPDGLKIQRIGRVAHGLSKTEIILCTNQPYVFDGTIIRRVTPTECEKLQTVPVGYTSSVRASQRYKMLGNGWTVDVIAHILKGIVAPNVIKLEQV